MTVTESRRASRARVSKGQDRQALARRERYLSRDSRDGLLGSLVTECQLPRAGRAVLVRRLDLSAMAAAGVWPQPITQAARRMMIDGALGGYKDDDRKFIAAAAAIARAAVIVPPPAFLSGDIGIDAITADMCRPLFVDPGQTPADDQFTLTVLDVARAARPSDEAVASAAEETARRLAEADADPAAMVLQTFDLVALMHHVLENAPGAHGRFRLADILSVGRVEAAPGDGNADQ